MVFSDGDEIFLVFFGGLARSKHVSLFKVSGLSRSAAFGGRLAHAALISEDCETFLYSLYFCTTIFAFSDSESEEPHWTMMEERMNLLKPPGP